MPKDVVRGVLGRLIEGADGSAWAHFEVIPESGWFRNLLSGKKPWVDVAYLPVGNPSVGVTRRRKNRVVAESRGTESRTVVVRIGPWV